MTRSQSTKATIIPLLAVGLLALPACKPPTPVEAKAQAEAKPQAEAASATATPTAADASEQAVIAKLKEAGVDATVSVDSTTPAPADNKPIELPEVVATVNGQNITKQQLQDIFNAALQSSGAKIGDLNSQQQLGGYTQLLQDLIMDKLVAEAASSENVSDADVDAELAKVKGQFPDDKAFQEQIAQAGMTPDELKKNIRTGLQQSRWMKSQVKTSEITDDQAKSFYESNIKEFEQPETVKASHILFMVDPDAQADVVKQKEEAATKAAERAAAGEDFTKLAKELSEEPGASESGGDLGFFPKDRMVPEFADAAFAQKVGDISKPVKTQFGWHVIKVTDKKAAGTMPFDQVKEQVAAYLKSNNQREAVQAVLNKLKESAKIETFLPAAS
jgi:parvulin-like peptidyl-prolyl isomerase